MATMTYKEQLLHPNWQRKRLEIMQRDEFHCKLCMDGSTTLHVHHKQYAKGRLAWEYPDDELVTLCEVCHETMHEQNAMMRDVIAKLPVDGPGCISNGMAVLAGWAHGEQGMDFTQVFEVNPTYYMAGEIANWLEVALRADVLLEVLDGVKDAPRWVLESAASNFARELRQRFDEPKPQGYGEPAL